MFRNSTTLTKLQGKSGAEQRLRLSWTCCWQVCHLCAPNLSSVQCIVFIYSWLLQKWSNITREKWSNIFSALILFEFIYASANSFGQLTKHVMAKIQVQMTCSQSGEQKASKSQPEITKKLSCGEIWSRISHSARKWKGRRGEQRVDVADDDVRDAISPRTLSAVANRGEQAGRRRRTAACAREEAAGGRRGDRGRPLPRRRGPGVAVGRQRRDGASAQRRRRGAAAGRRRSGDRRLQRRRNRSGRRRELKVRGNSRGCVIYIRVPL